MQTLLYDIQKSGIATLTLNRPEKNNAFDEHLIKSLLIRLKHIDKNSNIRVLILKANGENFCAGADVEWMQRMKNYSKKENLKDAKQLVDLLKQLNQLKKPTIALVQGMVAGGGNGLIACCDIVIASQDAHFKFGEVKLGIVPASIAPYVVNAIGTRMARRYFLSAEIFSAIEAQRIGLVHQLVNTKDLETTGNDFAKKLLKNGRKAVSSAKQLIQDCKPIDKKLIQKTVRLIASIRVTKEAQEGFSAFLEKREPKWG